MKTKLLTRLLTACVVVMAFFSSCVGDKLPSVHVNFVYVNATDSEVLMNVYSYMGDLEQTYSIDPGSSLILTEESYGGLVDGYPSGYYIPFADSGFLQVWVNGVMTEYTSKDVGSPYDIEAYALPSDNTLTYTYVFK